MQETPYTDALTQLFRFVGESWSLTKNAWGMWSVYLIYKGYFLPLGTADLICSLSPSELLDKVEVARRAYDLGQPYPFYNAQELFHAGPQFSSPHLTSLQQCPLARMPIPVSSLQQILQLPDGYDIKHLAIENGALHVYCLTPEVVNVHPKDVVGSPVMTADYLLDSRNGESWRRLMSVHVDITYTEPGRTV